MPHRDQREFSLIGNAEFLLDVVEMGTDGTWGNIKKFSDLIDRCSLGELNKDAKLSFREHFDGTFFAIELFQRHALR